MIRYLILLAFTGCSSGDQSTTLFAGRDLSTGSHIVEVEKTEVADEKTIKKELDRVPAAAKGRKPNQEETPAKDPNLNVVEAVTKAEHKVVAQAKAEKSKKIKKEEPPQMEVSMRSAKAPDRERVYIVQVGIFKVKANADALVKKLTDLGFPVIARTDNKPDVGEVTVVRLEPTPNKDEADQWVRNLKEKAGVAAVITKR